MPTQKLCAIMLLTLLVFQQIPFVQQRQVSSFPIMLGTPGTEVADPNGTDPAFTYMVVAVALIAIYGFNREASLYIGIRRDPTVDELYSILKTSSQNPNNWNFQLGHGHINLYSAYINGRAYFRPIGGDPGSGSGCGTTTCFYF
ncbi:MAG: hypothetical protein D6732_06050 [Methanobacteriota archaeon]|nr:MAG: hypothetical protein D6732_06050 [Euryarchaeota archaeon]